MAKQTLDLVADALERALGALEGTVPDDFLTALRTAADAKGSLDAKTINQLIEAAAIREDNAHEN